MKIPYLSGEYIHVYQPEPDIFHGPDSDNFRAGTRYEEWVPNDFTIVKGCGRWHLIGITHPKPIWFENADSFRVGMNVHEAEWQLFHAISEGETLRESLKIGGFRQVQQVLPAVERPQEIPDIYAPIVWNHDGVFHLIYAPDPMRLATSKDLTNWKTEGPIFFCNNKSARDPNIMEKDGVYTIVYLAGNIVYYRTSSDLRTYSEARVLFKCPDGVNPESPILKYIDGLYYLFFCIYSDDDIVNGAYDYRTFVYAASSLDELADAPCIARINAHAPELFQDENGDWYLASVEWPNRGVSIAPLEWKEQ